MAYEADKVVVELIAKVDGFDQPVKQSATSFDANMAKISASATGAERVVKQAADGAGSAHTRLTASVGNSRIAMLEFGHIARATADSIAVGTPFTQVFTQHIGQLGQAISLTGAQAGALGSFLGGPWGIALTFATVLLAKFALSAGDSEDKVDGLVQKLKEHHEKTLLNNDAQQIYDRTIDGSIEKMKALTDELAKQNLTLEDNINLKKAAIAATLTDVLTNIGGVGGQLTGAIAEYQAAKRRLDELQSGKLPLGENAGLAITSAQDQVNATRQRVADLTTQLDALSKAAETGARAIKTVDFPLIEQNAKDTTDAISAINHKYDEMAAAAKKAGTYTQALADSIEKQRKAALDAAKQKGPTEAEALAQFKAAVIGAEGTGKNALSSASGFGGFIAGTWLKEFDRVYPQFQAMSDAGKLALRDNKQVAEGIIDAYARENAAFLKGFGATITAANLYLSHVFGSGGAKRIIQADPNTPVGQVVSAAALKANPWIAKTGTAGGLRAEVGRRIGDSSSAIGGGLTAIQGVIDKQEKTLLDMLSTAREVTIEVGKALEVGTGFTRSILDANAAEAQLKEHIAEVANEMEAAKEIGGELIDDVLNPDNWDNWGDAGKRVLHDLLNELFVLAAVNPLKNWLLGSGLPTLGGIFGAVSGGFDSAGFSMTESSNAASLGLPSNFFRAAGGPVSGGKAYMVGEEGPEVFVPSASGTIIPNRRSLTPSNDVAALPMTRMGPGDGFRLEVSPSEYFDVRVQRIAGPMVAEGSARAAAGGSTLARRDLYKSQMHRLD